MARYRKQMDKYVLESLKDKIQNYLKSKGFKDVDLIRNNMNEIAALVVENSVENDGPLMSCRRKTKDRPSEIMIDKQFATIDKNDNPVSIDSAVEVLIKSQLTHELIHAAARFDKGTGIKNSDEYTALNEGMTQMFTEKIWNHTVSPNSDRRYKNFKKIAKIFDVTFGENVSIDAYFNHSDALKNACNNISKDENFFEDINQYMSICYMEKEIKIKDEYLKNINPQMINNVNDLLYKKICAEIIIPKLKSLPQNKQKEYLRNVFNSTKDDIYVMQGLRKNIIKYIRMTDKDLKGEVESINKNLKELQLEKNAIVNIYNSKDCSNLVNISKDGSTITTTQKPVILLNDEILKEKIFANLYFKGDEEKKKKFDEKVARFFENQKELFRFSKNLKNVLERKMVFSAMKVSAKERGYIVLNNLDECKSGNDINLDVVVAKEGEEISFDALREIYKNFSMDYKDKALTKSYIKYDKTGEEIKDVQLEKIAKFASVWVGASGSKWYFDEEKPGINYAFNSSSREIYKQVSELISNGMKKNGGIDTEKIYKDISNEKYKYSREIIEKLLFNSGNMKIVYEFFAMQNKQKKMETHLSRPSNDFVYGISDDVKVNIETEQVMEMVSALQKRKVNEGSITISKIQKAVKTYFADKRHSKNNLEDDRNR